MQLTDAQVFTLAIAIIIKCEEKMKLYISSNETNKVVAIVTGSSNEICEQIAESRYGSGDYGWTYSPAFGFAGGLEPGENIEEIDADA